ncbi:type II toxin-antitoxin system HicB family antitoxin [Methyloceanibacter methanicus]|nr:type II toxin-antitoxin system HicB family antitoxin [Methyloceanibacter methanicus]
MSYKGYQARIEYDDDDRIFWGRLAGINDIISFHADNVEALRMAFEEAVDDYLETCATHGKEPQKPYSGKMMFRVAPEVHRRAALAAELAGKSLNQWAEELIDSATRDADDGQRAA